MQLLLPVIGVVAVYLFLRGHDLPGGGFVAGLTMAVAFILQYMAGGTRWVEARLRIRPLRWIGVGLLLAAAHGLGSWLFGYPFLTSHTAHYVELPLHRRSAAASAIVLRPRRVPAGGRRHAADADRARPPVDPQPPRRAPPASRGADREDDVMELVLALGIGVLAGSGVWLLLRPRTFQVIIGLSLLSYAVNLFIFSMGGLRSARRPILEPGVPADLAHYTDPVPQALVLTAIVIGFATTALFLVVLLASRGLTGTDHVDGTGAGAVSAALDHLLVAADRAAAGRRGAACCCSTSGAARSRRRSASRRLSRWLGVAIALLLS